MDAKSYQQFTEQLRQNLEQQPNVLGLIALGSMAQQDYQPDQWSDHDFFVITTPGQQEAMRLNLDWLPDYDNIVFKLRETAHGMKVLYDNGHLLEFAIFDQTELDSIVLNRYRILLDRAELTRVFEKLSATPPTYHTYGQETFDSKQLGEFLTNLLVGVWRYRRGEQLSGHQFIKSYGLSHLLILLERHLPAENKALLDNLDPWRRFERVFPEIGAELNQILALEPDKCAQQLLALAARLLQDKLPSYPAEAVKVVTKLLQ